MSSLIPSDDPIRKFRRRQVALRRAGTPIPCICGETRLGALIPRSSPRICAECQRKSQGRSTTDNHHVAGRANRDLTLAVPVNDHRAILSEVQRDWPQKTLENPDGCPLLAAAASIRGFNDVLRYLTDDLLMWAATVLEVLSAFLHEELGPAWWKNTPIARFAPRRREHGGK
jgi:hypothetical protein